MSDRLKVSDFVEAEISAWLPSRRADLIRSLFRELPRTLKADLVDDLSTEFFESNPDPSSAEPVVSTPGLVANWIREHNSSDFANPPGRYGAVRRALEAAPEWLRKCGLAAVSAGLIWLFFALFGGSK